jgi:oxygen-dependent protoporphyrinogen oxidase
VFDSSAFPLQNKHPEETRLTVMMGGARNSNVPQDKSGKLALQTISAHLGIHEKPDAMLVKSAYQAIPQYPPHFSKTLKDQLQHIPPCITLLGSPYDGVSINECIQAAHEKA